VGYANQIASNGTRDEGEPRMTGERFEDLVVGDSIRMEQRIGAEDEAAFVALSGDLNPLHIDDGLARRHGFAARIAHGLLLGAFLLKTFRSFVASDGFLCLSQSFQFLKPVLPGETVELRTEVIRKSAGLRIAVLQTSIVNDRGDKVLTGEAKVRFFESTQGP
jgi:acyl dehydratase